MTRRGTYTDPQVEIAIARLCRELRDETGRNPSAAAVLRSLERDEELKPLVPKDARTIRRIIDELPLDESGLWSVAGADPDEVERVLPVLAHVARATEEGVRTLTRREASLIHRIRRAAPNLPMPSVWELTQAYIRDSGGEGGEVLAPYLDVLLALAPWQSSESHTAFVELIERAQLSDRARNRLSWTVRLVELHAALDEFKDDIAKLGHRGKGEKKEENDGKRTHLTAGKQVGVRGARKRRKRQE